MARYRIMNPELRIIAQGKQNAGKKYLYASLQNANCVWEAPQTFTSFNENVVNAYEQLLPLDKGGKAQVAQELPEELQYVTGCWIDWKPAQRFYKRHLSNHPAVPPSPTNPRGREAIMAGSLVMKAGTPIVYDTLRIFCLYYVDEFGEKTFLRGEGPEEVGQRAFMAYCEPIAEDHTPQDVINGASQPTPQQPANQQPASQPMQPQGVPPTGSWNGVPF